MDLDNFQLLVGVARLLDRLSGQVEEGRFAASLSRETQRLRRDGTEEKEALGAGGGLAGFNTPDFARQRTQNATLGRISNASAATSNS